MCWSEAIGLALTVAGPVIRGIQRNNAYKAEAAAARQAAEDAQTEAAIRKADRKERQAQMIAAQRARYGASGFDPNAGTPLTVYEDTAKQFAKEQFLDDYQTRRQVRSLKQSRKNLKQSGRNAVLGGFLDAGANVGSWMIKG